MPYGYITLTAQIKNLASFKTVTNFLSEESFFVYHFLSEKLVTRTNLIFINSKY